MSTFSDRRYLQRQIGHFSGGFTQDFAVVETILRDRQSFFEQIREGIGVPEKIRAMVVSSIAFLAVYGAVLGSTHSLIQALSSAVKLPLLFLATMLICIPTLYVFSVLFGSNQRLHQSMALVLSAITVMAVLMLSFASITLFFMLTTSGYQFFKLLNVFFFMVAGIISMLFLIHGMRAASTSAGDQGRIGRRLVLFLWIWLYAFVGSQMAWTLRPFVGYPGSKFELIRELGGNFYADIFRSIGELLGFFIVT
jgi:hypothetical protein